MRTGSLILFLLALFACACGRSAPVAPTADDLLSRSWDHKLISSGDNFPTVNLRREHRADLAILLHARVPTDTIRAVLGWSLDEYADRIEELVQAGLVRRDDRLGPVPTLLVMESEDVRRHMPVPGDLVEEAVALIAGRLDEIRDLYAGAPGLARVPFEDASLLVLSDVVLDNWQINAIEEQFLRADRPLRNGKRYYFALQENDTTDAEEAFGIYGNQYRGFGRYTVGVYGNRRTDNPLNFATLGAADLERLFGTEPDTVAVFKRELLDHLVSDPSAMPGAWREGFEAIGWMRDGQVTTPVLRDAELAVLDSISGLFTDDLVALFDGHRPELERQWSDSPYVAEVTFEEYFMWWFHLWYTAVTDRMAERGMLTVPASGITSYVMVREN